MISRNVTEDIISIIKDANEKTIGTDDQHAIMLIPFALKALRRLLRRDVKSRYRLAYRHEVYRMLIKCKLVYITNNSSIRYFKLLFVFP